MKTPYEILGVQNVTLPEMVNVLKERLGEIEESKNEFDQAFKVGVPFASGSHALARENVEAMLNEKYYFGIPLDSKFYKPREVSELLGASRTVAVIKKAQLLEGNVDGKSFSDREKKLRDTFFKNFGILTEETRRLKSLLQRYEENSEDIDVGNDITDEFIKIAFEDSVINLANQLHPELQVSGASAISTPPINPDVNILKRNVGEHDFLHELESNSEYLNLKQAFERINTSKKRIDLSPELFVTSRLDRPELFKVGSVHDTFEILKSESRHQKDFDKLMREKNAGVAHMQKKGYSQARIRDYKAKYPINPPHQAQWGAILRTPKTIIDNKRVVTSDFSGTITVEDIGVFTSDYSFTTRQFLREKRARTDIENANNDKTLITDKNGKPITARGLVFYMNHTDVERDSKKHMRDYYIANVSTGKTYNSIYRVTKVDSLTGQKRSSVIISGLEPEAFQTEDLDYKGFLTQIYLSEYSLEKFKQNAGFAGTVVKTPKGYSIDTKNGREMYEAAVLFENLESGKIMDYTLGTKTPMVIDPAYKSDFSFILQTSSRNNRERSHDE